MLNNAPMRCYTYIFFKSLKKKEKKRRNMITRYDHSCNAAVRRLRQRDGEFRLAWAT